MTEFTETPIRKFYPPTDYECPHEDCGEKGDFNPDLKRSDFKKVVIVLRDGHPSWWKQPDWEPLPGNPYPVDKTIFGVVCKNDHFVYDPEASVSVTHSNRNGNRGKQYVLARASCFTYWHDDFEYDFFLTFTDKVMRQMIKDGYYDPRDPDVIDLQRNIYAEDEIIARPEINEAKKVESDKDSSKWKNLDGSEFSSISKIDEWRKKNPWKPMLQRDPNRGPRAAEIEGRIQNFVDGVTGTIAEQIETPQDELALSDFPGGSVGDTTASSSESEIESPERSSTPAPELINEKSTQTPDSSNYCNCGTSPPKTLESQVEKQKEDFFSKASNWLKNNTEVHVAFTVFLAAVVLSRRSSTIVAIFR